MKSAKEYVINILISLVIFAIILSIFDLDEIIEVTMNSNPYFLLLAILAYIIVLIIMSVRIKFILNKLKYKSSFLSTMEANLAGMLASDFTPARSGYFFTAFSLSSKHKIPINDSILTILGPQLFDFAIKATSLVVILILMLNTFEELQENLLFSIVSIVGIFFTIGFFGALIFVKGFIDKFSFIKKVPFGNKIYSLFNLMQKRSHELMNIKWEIVLLTLGSWCAKALEWYLLSKAFGISIFDGGIYDYLFILVFQGAITLIHFIPIPTIAGSGASEAGFAGILYLFGVPLETGIAFALSTRLIMIIVDLVGIKEIIRYAKKEGISKIIKEINSVGH